MTNTDPAKLYIAVRGDLSPGQQLAQSVHAMAEFAVEYPSLTEVWRRNSNFFVGVGVRDEDVLLELANSAAAFGVRHIVVREPDCGNTVTAVALEPTQKAQQLCAEYPLALKERSDLKDRIRKAVTSHIGNTFGSGDEIADDIYYEVMMV